MFGIGWRVTLRKSARIGAAPSAERHEQAS
jgi:hypothetical protein